VRGDRVGAGRLSGLCAARSEALRAQLTVRTPKQPRSPVREFNEVVFVVFNR
jgi:hypothetical protein